MVLHYAGLFSLILGHLRMMTVGLFILFVGAIYDVGRYCFPISQVCVVLPAVLPIIHPSTGGVEKSVCFYRNSFSTFTSVTLRIAYRVRRRFPLCIPWFLTLQQTLFRLKPCGLSSAFDYNGVHCAGEKLLTLCIYLL